jgi:hypothetical protein
VTTQPKSETLKKWETRRASDRRVIVEEQVGPERFTTSALTDFEIGILRLALPIIERLVGR